MNFYDAIGWLGFVLVLFSYAMVAMRKWRVRSVENQVGNLLGSVCLSVNSLVYHASVPLVLNVIWGLIACATLFQIFNIKNRKPIGEN